MAETTENKPANTSSTNKAPAPTKESVTGTILLATKSFHSGSLDDEDARLQFINAHKSEIKPDTVTLVGKSHDIGTGVTYSFTAEAK